MKRPSILKGGLADNAHKKPDDFDPSQLDRGTKVELEHTKDKSVAQAIAMDHLTEDPDYYKKLAKMEEGRDDFNSLNLPAASKKYSRGTGLKFMKGQAQSYIDSMAAVTGQNKYGFKNKDASQLSAKGVVSALLTSGKKAKDVVGN